ncbi:uncharacterized protein [Miscanthus floridulus]|uniref:uncharacterized protein n=1 Tax=Miscanthus floridulus TaxID=154761 RepID=UPI00345A0ACF
MTTHIKSINRNIWQVVETKFEVANPNAPTAAEEEKLQNNDIALSVIHDAINQRVFEQIKNMEMAHDAWVKLEESYEGTQAVMGAKAYILKEKFASFKMKEDENVPEMFHRLQVLVNDLKELGEEVKDKDFSHKFLRCLLLRFGMLVTLLVRSGLDTMTPNQVLGDVMIDDTYRDDKEENEKKDEKKKSVAFKATSSSKGKAKQEESSNDECPSTCDEEDGEAMALFVKRFGKFMMKKGYRARRKKRSSKNKDEPRRCFKCNSKDHLIVDYTHNSDNDDDKNIKNKGKKESKMIFKKKKKGGSYRKECKELRKSNKALEQSFEELKASYERLMEAHEKLKEAHTKLEKAHSSLVVQNEKEQIQTTVLLAVITVSLPRVEAACRVPGDTLLECQQGVPLVRYAARTLSVTTGGWLGLLLCMCGEQGTRSS